MRKHGIVSKYGKKVDRSKITPAIQSEIDALQVKAVSKVTKKAGLSKFKASGTFTTPAVPAKLAKTGKPTKKDTGKLPSKATLATLVDAGVKPIAAKPVVTLAKAVDSTAKPVRAKVIKSLLPDTEKTVQKKTVKKNGLDSESVGVAPVVAPAVNVLIPRRKVAPVDPAGAVKATTARKTANKEGEKTLQEGNRDQAQIAHNKLQCVTPVIVKGPEVAGTRISNLQAIGVSTVHKMTEDDQEAHYKKVEKDADFDALDRRAVAIKERNTAKYLKRLAALEEFALAEDKAMKVKKAKKMTTKQATAGMTNLQQA